MVYAAGTYPLLYVNSEDLTEEVLEGAFAAGTGCTTIANPFTEPEGKRFAGWDTSADGTGIRYPSGMPFIMPEEDFHPLCHLAGTVGRRDNSQCRIWWEHHLQRLDLYRRTDRDGFCD